MIDFHTFSIVVSSISIFCEILSTFFIFYFRAYSKIRFEVLVYLNIICFLFNIAFIIPFDSGVNLNPGVCAVQSFSISFFELAKICLTTFISYSVFLTCLKVDYVEKTIDTMRKWLAGIVFLVSFPIPLS